MSKKNLASLFLATLIVASPLVLTGCGETTTEPVITTTEPVPIPGDAGSATPAVVPAADPAPAVAPVTPAVVPTPDPAATPAEPPK